MTVEHELLSFEAYCPDDRREHIIGEELLEVEPGRERLYMWMGTSQSNLRL